MFQGWLDVCCHFSKSDIMIIICLNNHDYTTLHCFWPIRLLNYRWFKSLIPLPNQLIPPVSYMMSSKWCQPLDAEQLTCHNAGIVTRCLLKLLHKHHATCALLAIQKSMLDYDRKVVNWRVLSFKRRAVPIYLQDSSICDLASFCTLLGVGRCYSTLQSLKGTRKKKYSINTLYDGTEGYNLYL